MARTPAPIPRMRRTAIRPIARDQLEDLLRQFIAHGQLDQTPRRQFYRRDYAQLVTAFRGARSERRFRALIGRVIRTWMRRNQPPRNAHFERALFAVACRAGSIDLLRQWPRRVILASKVLHFAQPDAYPIWDTFIARKMGVKHVYSWDRYVDWISAVKSITPRLADRARAKYSGLVRYPVSEIRAIEAALYDAR